ncbi:EscI/YscI/HrpB family type III secretion system inner rod protein [Pseudoduganella chitinolytica]|uniref:EscI/YscI/HrpB family type III secretion system inner rod protein n=1 Tax=Pseudoduganella chitinolytica TaxID=34070 RepID=A0ABY8B8H9_9BURK|nr:EscI/YscI/HrpB family type III secretion system inner rod protein [Pseudoduganella chitinolytica]WEF32236.1 EscI/YscI/HrpB family type III secretion system inner rod protein [Pseudoduganella chitinolytica]
MNASAAAINTPVTPQPATQVRVTGETAGLEQADAAQFRQALERQQAMNGPAGAPREPSLGQAIASRAAGLAGELKKDQQYVSRLLEKATTSGDSMHLMRAMLALNDYQLRVQTVSKVVSKASTSIDSLTKLQ